MRWLVEVRGQLPTFQMMGRLLPGKEHRWLLELEMFYEFIRVVVSTEYIDR